MTEAEWLSSTDPAALLTFLRGSDRVTERTLRLFACACARRICHLSADGRSGAGVEVRERYETGRAAENELLAAAAAAQRARNEARAPFRFAARVNDRGREFAPVWAAAAATTAAWGNPSAAPDFAAHAAACVSPAGWSAGWAAERACQTELLRDLVGNPFRPPLTLGPHFRTPELVALATAIDDDHGWKRLPDLAAALERRGFDDADILAHLRGPGPHVRGCFVLDAVLANRMPDPAEERPWEQPGAFRLDFEPHRGFFLIALAVLCLLCGLIAVGLVLPALLGLPASVAMWQTTKRDLGEIGAGRMDPQGLKQAELALDCAAGGVALNLLALLHGGLLFCFLASP